MFNYSLFKLALIVSAECGFKYLSKALLCAGGGSGTAQTAVPRTGIPRGAAHGLSTLWPC